MEYPRQLNLQTFEERQETDKWSIELVQKMHILENRLEVSEKAHYRTLEQLRIATKVLEDLELANDIRISMKAHEALAKMEGVK